MSPLRGKGRQAATTYAFRMSRLASTRSGSGFMSGSFAIEMASSRSSMAFLRGCAELACPEPIERAEVSSSLSRSMRRSVNSSRPMAGSPQIARG